jgi:hypothetical protein
MPNTDRPAKEFRFLESVWGPRVEKENDTKRTFFLSAFVIIMGCVGYWFLNR